MDDTGTKWDVVYDNTRDFKCLSTSELNHILSKANKDSSLSAIDIGCGTGQISRDLYHRGYNVLGIDNSKIAIQLARNSTVKLGDGINFQIIDVENKFELIDKYGLVLCKHTYAFIKNRDRFLENVRNLMDDRALFVIVSPSVESQPDQKRHITVNCSDTLKLLSKYFSQTEHVTLNGDDYFYCY